MFCAKKVTKLPDLTVHAKGKVVRQLESLTVKSMSTAATELPDGDDVAWMRRRLPTLAA
jgi:hypothetical protein